MFHTKKTKIRRFTKDSKVYKGSYYNHNSFHIASIPLRYPVDCNDRRALALIRRYGVGKTDMNVINP